MTPPSGPAPLSLAHGAYAHGYERLRLHAIQPGTQHNRQGLAVVARRGVAAWLHALAELPAPPSAGDERGAPEPLPAGVDRPMIDILLAMLMGHMGRELA